MVELIRDAQKKLIGKMRRYFLGSLALSVALFPIMVFMDIIKRFLGYLSSYLALVWYISVLAFAYSLIRVCVALFKYLFPKSTKPYRVYSLYKDEAVVDYFVSQQKTNDKALLRFNEWVINADEMVFFKFKDIDALKVKKRGKKSVLSIKFLKRFKTRFVFKDANSAQFYKAKFEELKSS